MGLEALGDFWTVASSSGYVTFPPRILNYSEELQISDGGVLMLQRHVDYCLHTQAPFIVRMSVFRTDTVCPQDVMVALVLQSHNT